MIKLEAAQRLMADNHSAFTEACAIVTHALGDPDETSSTSAQWDLPNKGQLTIRKRSTYVEMFVSLDARRVSEEQLDVDTDIAKALVDLCRNSASRNPCKEMKIVIDCARGWHAHA